MQKAHLADFHGFQIEFDNYGSTHSPENRAVLRRDLGRPARRRTGQPSKRSRSFTTRWPARSWPTASSRGPAPSASRPTSTATVATSAAATTAPTDLIDPVSTLSGAKPEIRTAEHLFVNIERLHGFLDEWVARAAPCSRRWPTISRATSSTSRCAIGTFAAGAVLRLRDSRQPGQLLVRVVRRPDRLPGLDRGSGATPQGEQFDDWWRSPETEVHHFIGKDITYFHTLFWPAMLEDGRLQPAEESPHPRLPDRQRREDVEVEGDLHPGVDVPGAPRPGLPALLLRLEARPRAWKTST